MQLDIFSDGRDTMLRNDVIAALERRDAEAAGAARLVLERSFEADDTLAAQALLVDALQSVGGSPWTDHEALRRARTKLESEVEPAAQRLLGEAAGQAWLLPLWRDLAQRAASLPFRSESSEDHAAACLLGARDWAAAAEAAGRIESWRRIPAPLAWMAEARYRQLGLDAAWPLLAELAWLAPKRFDRLTRALGDPLLDRLRKRFDASFDGGQGAADLAWFPAWLLTDTPALVRFVGQAQPSLHQPAERAMRLILDLLQLERQGRHHELVAHRRELRGLNTNLFASYMSTR